MSLPTESTNSRLSSHFIVYIPWNADGLKKSLSDMNLPTRHNVCLSVYELLSPYGTQVTEDCYSRGIPLYLQRELDSIGLSRSRRGAEKNFTLCDSTALREINYRSRLSLRNGGNVVPFSIASTLFDAVDSCGGANKQSIANDCR